MKKLTAVAAFLFLAGLVRGVEDRIERIAADTDSTIGVAAIHVESGRRVDVRAAEPFPMGSVSKFPLAIAILREVDAGRRSLSDDVTIEPAEFDPGHSPIRARARGRAVELTLGEVLEAMVKESDNTASAALQRIAGGRAALAATFRDLGIEDDESTTPAEMVTLLQRFHSGRAGLSRESHDLLVRLMTTTSGGQRRIRAGTPPGASVANRTGTLPGAVSDVGIITSPNGRDHVLIAVFAKGGRRTATITQRERAVASVTRIVYRDLIDWPRRSARQ